MFSRMVKCVMENKLKQAIQRMVQFSAPDKIILFGSRAKGTNTEQSDYDICILKKNVTHRRKLAQKLYLSLSGLSFPADIIVEGVLVRCHLYSENPNTR